MQRDIARRSVLVGVASASLAGCVGLFGDGREVTVSHLGDPVTETTVSMTARGGDRFDPTLVHVTTGGTVTWELVSGVHDTVAYHPDNDKPLRMPDNASPWNSGLLSSGGEEFSVTFDTEGVYDYVCTPHEHVGMVGRVVVGSPSPDDEPALSQDTSPLPREATRVFDTLNQQVKDALG